MDLKSEINELLQKAWAENAIVNKELKHLPAGQLRIWAQGQYTRFIQEYNWGSTRKRKGVGKKPEVLGGLARKAYLKASQRLLLRNMEVLRKAEKQLLPASHADIVSALPEGFRQLPGAIFTSNFNDSIHPTNDHRIPVQEVSLWLDGETPAEWGRKPYRLETPAEWGRKPYRVNTLFSETKRTIMPGGLAVRSKSEAAIIGRFRHFGIPFHYDELLSANGRFISPDLIGARRDGKLIWLDHFGMMDDPGYRRKAQERLKTLESLGFVPWDNLIVTYERPEGSVNIQLVDELLRDKFLL